jgi:hypothetical protein
MPLASWPVRLERIDDDGPAEVALANLAVREAIDQLVPPPAPRPARPAPLAGGGPIANRKKTRR